MVTVLANFVELVIGSSRAPNFSYCTLCIHFLFFFLIGDCLSLEFTAFFQDIECVQVLVLLYAVGQIIASVPILTMRVACRGTVNLAMEGILVDIEILHPLSLEEGVVAGHLVEVLMDLTLVLGH